jgi:hypothetical protein
LNIEIKIYSTRKRFECVRERQKSPALGPGKQTAKTGFGLEKNRKKISQIINAYLYLPFFLLKRLEVSVLYIVHVLCITVCLTTCLAVGGIGMHGIQKKNLTAIAKSLEIQ